MHLRGLFGSVVAYLIRSLLVYVWCTVQNQSDSELSTYFCNIPYIFGTYKKIMYDINSL